MTHLLAVRDVGRARAFYTEVLGGRVVMEENPCIVGAESRCYVRDPDGDLIEVGQATGVVEGRLGERAPAGREAGRVGGR
jgi:hypothetical protein